MCMYVCLSVRLSVCLSACLSVCVSVCLNACMSVCMHAYMTVHTCVCACMHVYVSLFVCLCANNDLACNLFDVYRLRRWASACGRQPLGSSAMHPVPTPATSTWLWRTPAGAMSSSCRRCTSPANPSPSTVTGGSEPLHETLCNILTCFVGIF